jgi:hypothetical protein
VQQQLVASAKAQAAAAKRAADSALEEAQMQQEVAETVAARRKQRWQAEHDARYAPEQQVAELRQQLLGAGCWQC